MRGRLPVVAHRLLRCLRLYRLSRSRRCAVALGSIPRVRGLGLLLRLLLLHLLLARLRLVRPLRRLRSHLGPSRVLCGLLLCLLRLRLGVGGLLVCLLLRLLLLLLLLLLLCLLPRPHHLQHAAGIHNLAPLLLRRGLLHVVQLLLGLLLGLRSGRLPRLGVHLRWVRAGLGRPLLLGRLHGDLRRLLLLSVSLLSRHLRPRRSPVRLRGAPWRGLHRGRPLPPSVYRPITLIRDLSTSSLSETTGLRPPSSSRYAGRCSVR